MGCACDHQNRRRQWNALLGNLVSRQPCGCYLSLYATELIGVADHAHPSVEMAKMVLQSRGLSLLSSEIEHEWNVVTCVRPHLTTDSTSRFQMPQNSCRVLVELMPQRVRTGTNTPDGVADWGLTSRDVKPSSVQMSVVLCCRWFG